MKVKHDGACGLVRQMVTSPRVTTLGRTGAPWDRAVAEGEVGAVQDDALGPPARGPAWPKERAGPPARAGLRRSAPRNSTGRVHLWARAAEMGAE